MPQQYCSRKLPNFCPCVSSKAAVTEKTIGNIIIAVVLDIHMDKKAEANIKPHNILKDYHL
jgi:hypothetical protein